MNNYKRILVGIDGSDESYKALDKAIQIAKHNNSKLFLGHIIDIRPLQTYSTISMDVVEHAQIQAQAEMEKVTNYVRARDYDNFEVKLEYGSPRNKMATEIPEEENIDLIVVGATGANVMERLFMGSISTHIVRHAPCDVLVTREEIKE